MSDITSITEFPRRDFLKAGGALVIGFAVGGHLQAQQPAGTVTAAQPDATRLDTWLAIHADSTATIFIGFVELGQGNTTALLQIAAEELDLEMGQVKTARIETG